MVQISECFLEKLRAEGDADRLTIACKALVGSAAVDAADELMDIALNADSAAVAYASPEIDVVTAKLVREIVQIIHGLDTKES
jgi:hypothetical protein